MSNLIYELNIQFPWVLSIYLSMKMSWKKWNFEPIGDSAHTISRLYLKVKVYITNLLSLYNLQKTFCFK